MSAPTGRFDVAIETIGEQGSPIHWIVQTVAMLRSGIFVSLIKDCFYELKNTADLFLKSAVCCSVIIINQNQRIT